MSDAYNRLRNAILGFVVGDALGVPYEFKTVEEMKKNPAKDMVGFGTHYQPVGTWSDDSSMMFVLMEWLITLAEDDVKLSDLTYTHYFLLKSMWNDWRNNGYWTPRGDCFDIGNQTNMALAQRDLISEVSMNPLGQGNGALMRILPFGFLMPELGDKISHFIVENVMFRTCEITHGSLQSNYYCMKYVENIAMMKNRRASFAYDFDCHQVNIKSSGWVVDSYWCANYSALLGELNASYLPIGLSPKTHFKKAVLMAINFGEDTDTVGAITGGLVGASYTEDCIPDEWLSKIVKLNEIEDLIKRFYNAYLKE